MAIEKVNEEINLEIEPNSAQEIDALVMEGDALMLEDGSAIVNPAEDTTDQGAFNANLADLIPCLLYTSPSPRDGLLSRMPSSA